VYVYDYAGVISSDGERRLNTYLGSYDGRTTNEIVVYTIPSFVGHGIRKDGVEIQDRDMLANYIFNEVTLDGIKGIGKKGKDNGVLVLLSLERDAGGGSMRIEVGRGLEGEITDGTAGRILDQYLVPAMAEYEQSGDTGLFDEAFMSTVIDLAVRADTGDAAPADDSSGAEYEEFLTILLLLAFPAAIAILRILSRRRRFRRYGGYYVGWGGGYGGRGGGGFGGGGGGSGGGGAGR
jgi:uncharacterized protein